MKKMTHAAVMAVTLMLTSIGVTSCDDFLGSSPKVYSYTIATVKVLENKDCYFLSDKNNKIYPANLNNMRYEAVDGQRIIAFIDELNEKKEGYNLVVNVVEIKNILTKDFVKLTDPETDKQKNDSIGDDPMFIRNYWIANGYLNIQFYIWHSPYSDIKHMINMVEFQSANADQTDKYLNLELRHNRKGDEPRVRGIGLVSFKLSDLAGKEGLKIRVNTPFEGAKIYTVALDEDAESSRTVEMAEVEIN